MEVRPSPAYAALPTTNLADIALSEGGLKEAVDHHHRALQVRRSAGDIQMADNFEGLGVIAARQGDNESAARFFGIAEATRAKMDGATRVTGARETMLGPAQPLGVKIVLARTLRPTGRKFSEPVVRAVRNALGDDRFKDAREEGRAMSVADAIDRALGLTLA